MQKKVDNFLLTQDYYDDDDCDDDARAWTQNDRVSNWCDNSVVTQQQ